MTNPQTTNLPLSVPVPFAGFSLCLDAADASTLMVGGVARIQHRLSFVVVLTDGTRLLRRVVIGFPGEGAPGFSFAATRRGFIEVVVLGQSATSVQVKVSAADHVVDAAGVMHRQADYGAGSLAPDGLVLAFPDFDMRADGELPDLVELNPAQKQQVRSAFIEVYREVGLFGAEVPTAGPWPDIVRQLDVTLAKTFYARPRRLRFSVDGREIEAAVLPGPNAVHVFGLSITIDASFAPGHGGPLSVTVHQPEGRRVP